MAAPDSSGAANGSTCTVYVKDYFVGSVDRTKNALNYATLDSQEKFHFSLIIGDMQIFVWNSCLTSGNLHVLEWKLLISRTGFFSQDSFRDAVTSSCVLASLTLK